MYALHEYMNSWTLGPVLKSYSDFPGEGTAAWEVGPPRVESLWGKGEEASSVIGRPVS